MHLSYPRLLGSYLFTFSIEAKDIVVHSGVIARQSKILSNLIYGNTVEAQAGHACLDHVRLGTFQKFCEYAYFGRYTDPPPELWGAETLKSIDQIPQTLHGPDRGEDLGCADGSRTQGGMSTLDVSISPCAELDGYHRWREAFGTDSALYDVTKAFSARHYPVEHSYQSPKLPWKAPSNTPPRDFSPAFLGHAELYGFANKYKIEGLKNLVLHKLHTILEKYKATPDNLPAVLDLIEYTLVDHNNGDLPDTSSSVDPLQALVCHYMLTQLEIVRSNDLFTTFLEDSGPFFGLFWEMLGRTVIYTHSAKTT